MSESVSESYFTSSYIIGTGYQDFPFLWYNYGTKTRLLLHFFTGNTFKELFVKVRKISDTLCSYDVLIFNCRWLLSGCPPCPIHHKFITSFNRDTPRLVSECLGFEKSLGFLKMVSDHLVVWLHHPEKGQLVLRYCITIFCKLFQL